MGKKFGIAFLLMVGVVVSFTGPVKVLAQESESLQTQRREWRSRNGVLGFSDRSVTDENCQQVQERIDNRATSINSAAEKRAEKYDAVISRLQRIITTASDNEYDTKNLSEALTELESHIGNYATAVSKLSETLTKISQLDCEESASVVAMRDLILEARELLREVRSESEDIHQHLKEDILRAIKEIKQEMKEASRD